MRKTLLYTQIQSNFLDKIRRNIDSSNFLLINSLLNWILKHINYFVDKSLYTNC